MLFKVFEFLKRYIAGVLFTIPTDSPLEFVKKNYIDIHFALMWQFLFAEQRNMEISVGI